MNAWTFIDFTLIMFFAWLSFLYRQTWKKQSLIDSGIITRNAIRMNNQEIDAELLKDYKDKNKELSILLHQKITFADELKKSFEQAVAEIKKLVATEAEKDKQIAFLKSVKNHKKRPVFDPDIKEWECSSEEYLPCFYPKQKYKIASPTILFDKNTTLLLTSENGESCLVDKNSFTPVKET